MNKPEDPRIHDCLSGWEVIGMDSIMFNKASKVSLLDKLQLNRNVKIVLPRINSETRDMGSVSGR